MGKYIFRAMETEEVIIHRSCVFTFAPRLGEQSPTGKTVTTLSAAKGLDGLLSGQLTVETRKSFHSPV